MDLLGDCWYWKHPVRARSKQSSSEAETAAEPVGEAQMMQTLHAPYFTCPLRPQAELLLIHPLYEA